MPSNTPKTARDSLTPGSSYTGTLVGIGPDQGRYAVSVDGSTVLLDNCVWAAGLLSSMLGLRSAYIPPVGARVAVIYTSPPCIVGMLPSGQGGDPNTRDKIGATTSHGLRVGLDGLSERLPGTSMDEVNFPADLLPGELDLTNVFGVGVQLLTHFAKMQAGELAKVECHVLNDMVRIVSENFKHHSSFGDFEIFNDGGLNMRLHGTSTEHEAWGALSENDEKVKADAKGVDFSSVDGISATGRWRFSNYLGWLGNFVHVFVTDPTAVLGTIGQDALRSGKCGIHIDDDGSFLLSSVADIALERVVRIPVPVECKRHDDPAGVKARDFSKLEQQFLKLWEYPKDPRRLFETTFQLREYARYLSQFQALSRFHQLEKSKSEYRVPSETETPNPEWTGKKKDVEDANKSIAYKYFDTYACIRIMRDGSIIQWDGYGSCVVTSHGDVRLCATRHLTLEAAGDIRMIAGQNIYAKARRNFEIVAVAGGLRLKARAWLHALCEWGTLWLKSDAQDPGAVSFQAPTPDDATEDPVIVYNDAAVLIEASRGRVTADSARTLLLQASGFPDAGKENDPDDVSASVVIQSKAQHTKVRAEDGLTLQANRGFVTLRSTFRSVIIKGYGVWLRIKRSLRINDIIELNSAGTVKAQTLRVSAMSALSTIMGPEVAGPSPGGGQHFNHILKLPDDTSALSPDLDEDEVLTEDDTKAAQVRVDVYPAFPVKGDLRFKFDTFAEYVTDPVTFVESPAQQFLRLDLPTEWQDGYATMPPDTLKAAPRVASDTAPFPGRGATVRRHNGGSNLRTATSDKGVDLRKQTKLISETNQFVFLKKSFQYK